MASTKLSRTAGTPTSNKTFTISYWVKRSNIGSAGNGHIFDTFVDSSNRSQIHFDDDNVIDFRLAVSGTNIGRLKTNRVFRDTSAWYHIVASVDTTLGTADDRVKLYINGVQETSFSTRVNPSINADFPMGGTHTLGAYGGGSNYFDGTLSHFHFTDGYAYTPSTFGESDSTSGIWKPKTAPSVTYGTNGFFLKFENSGAMGTDSSGNSNTFTVSGTLTQNVDTPSNNFNTLNGIGVRASNFTLSNGNSSATCGADWETLEGTLGVNKGKWYYEAKWNGSNYFMAGWTSTNFMSKVPTSYVGHTITEPSYALGLNDAKVYYSTSSSATQDSAVWGNTLTSSDILGCAIDIDNGKLYWSKNGVWMNSGDPTSGATGTGAYSITDTATNYFWQPVMGCYNSAGNFNFGQGYFGTTAVASANADDGGLGIMEYDVPANYRVLCTKNIKDYG